MKTMDVRIADIQLLAWGILVLAFRLCGCRLVSLKGFVCRLKKLRGLFIIRRDQYVAEERWQVGGRVQIVRFLVRQLLCFGLLVWPKILTKKKRCSLPCGQGQTCRPIARGCNGEKKRLLFHAMMCGW